MSLKHAVFAGAILAFCAAVDAAPAAAQQVNCDDLYNHVMAIYQAAPQSPEYAQISAAYSANCLAGAAAAPGYPPYDPQYPGPEYQPNYGYAAPDYSSYGGYGYAVPVGVGIGLGVGHGFHHGGDFHERGGFHQGGDFHERGRFQGAGFHPGGGPHGDGGHGGGRGGDHGHH